MIILSSSSTTKVCFFFNTGSDNRVLDKKATVLGSQVGKDQDGQILCSAANRKHNYYHYQNPKKKKERIQRD
jgi:hypothetical protein